MEFLLLHLNHWVLHLLLSLLLLGLLLCLLEQLLRCICSQQRNLIGQLRRHLLVLLLRWQGHAHRLLNLFAVLERNVLVDVRHSCGHDGRCCRIHLQHLLNLRVLYGGHMHLYMRLVVLFDERLDRLVHQHVLVLLYGVCRHCVLIHRHELLGVLDAQDLNHLAVQKW